MEKYQLQKSKVNSDWWVLTDTEKLIVIKWQNRKFNTTQKVTPIEDEKLLQQYGLRAAIEIARATRDATEYLRINHPDKL